MQSTLIAILVIVFLMVGWAVVQALWRRLFADQISDEDVLADRRSCGNCGCAGLCERDASKGIKKQNVWHV